MARLDVERFKANPHLFIENAIKEFVAGSPSNRLPAFHDDPVFDEPLVGFADGDDPIFQDYRRIIGDSHLTPREALAKHPQLMGDSISGRRPRGLVNRCVNVRQWQVPLPV